MWLNICWLGVVLREAILPQQGEAVEGLPPALDVLPSSGQVVEGEIHHLQGSVLAGEGAARLDGLAQTHVQALNGVGGVDDLADLSRELEEGDHAQFLRHKALIDGYLLSHVSANCSS